MTGLEIGLLIIGAVFFVGSFFVSEKLSGSDLSEIEGLSEDQIKVILDKKLGEADSKIDESLNSKLNDKTEEFIAGADKETNNRIMSIGEYADSVFNSMNKTHEEIMFLYQMLNDKQESLTQLTKTLGEAESHVRELMTEASHQKEELEQMSAKPLTIADPVPVKQTSTDNIPEAPSADDKDDVETTDDTDKKSDENKDTDATDNKSAVADEADRTDQKQKVISMYHQGYSILDIARETGQGMGEVQLIIELFDDKEEDPS